MGLPAEWNFSSAGTKSHASSSLRSVVLSPPGMTRPATSSSWPGILTSVDVDADPVERLPVKGEVPLEREHADLHADRTSCQAHQ